MTDVVVEVMRSAADVDEVLFVNLERKHEQEQEQERKQEVMVNQFGHFSTLLK